MKRLLVLLFIPIVALFAGCGTTKDLAYLQTMEKQVYTNIIYGNESIDAFDKFVEDWYAQGGDKITEEVNEWYQSVK